MAIRDARSASAQRSLYHSRMLRISRTENSTSVIFRLEGKLREPWVAEFNNLLSEPSNDNRKLQLDLAGVSFADMAGTELLRVLVGRGAAIVACSQFVAELLNAERP